jgi:hypothetical protein
MEDVDRLIMELRAMRKVMEKIARLWTADQKAAKRFEREAKAAARDIEKIKRGERTQDWVPASCTDCGAAGERRGHQACPYPSSVENEHGNA